MSIPFEVAGFSVLYVGILFVSGLLLKMDANSEIGGGTGAMLEPVREYVPEVSYNL